jgi:hypothetical protein
MTEEDVSEQMTRKSERSLSDYYFCESEVEGEWCIIPKKQVHLLTAVDVEYPALGFSFGGIEEGTILKTKLYELATIGSHYVTVGPIVGTPEERYDRERGLNLSPNHVLITDAEVKWDYSDDE